MVVVKSMYANERGNRNFHVRCKSWYILLQFKFHQILFFFSRERELFGFEQSIYIFSENTSDPFRITECI